MLRLSVTDVEQYRAYQAPDGYLSLPEVLRRLQHVDPPTDNMAIGTAFHEYLEHANAGTYAGVTSQGYVFTFMQDMAVTLPHIREMRTTRVQVLGDVAVTVSGKVDCVDAASVYDHKVTGQYDAEKYMDSCQWRLYLWMLGKRRFFYNIFTRGKVDGMNVEIKACDVLTLYAYPAMADDCVDLLRDCVLFYEKHLPERFTDDEARKN